MINELVGIIGLLLTVLVLVIKATAEISKMKNQLFPNGGSSLSDKVTRLQIEVSQISTSISSIETQLGKPKRKTR
jgi:hypothetical protein